MASMKVQDLKKELKARGLSTAGNKTELIERLQAIGDAPKDILLDLQSGISSEELLASTAAAEEDEVFSGRQLIPPTASQDDAEEYVDCADESPATGTTFDPKGLQDGLESQTTEQFSPSGTLLDTVQIAGVPEIRRQDCDAGSTQGPSEECLADTLEDCSRGSGWVGESRKSEGCNRAQDQRRGAPTIEKKESGSTSSTVDDDKLADSVVDSVKLLAGSDDNRDEAPGEKDTSTPAKSKVTAKSVVRPPWGVKKEVLIVGDSNVGRFAPAFSEQIGGGQNFDVLLNRKATVEIAHRMIADYEATARRIPRMYILHVGMQDLLQGQQPDDIVESLEKKWCFREVALTVCSVPEVTSRGKETQAAAMMLNSRLRKMCKKIHAKYVDLSRNLVNDGFMEKDGLRYSNQGINMVTGRLVGLANRFLGRQGKDRRMKAQQDREQDGLVDPAQQRPLHEPINQTAGTECGQTRTAPLLAGHVPCGELWQQRLSQGAYVRRQRGGEEKD
ncbi:hypothetical protein ISCGN_003639 [Ixodes scapularis]